MAKKVMNFEVQIDGFEKVNSLFTKAYCKIGYAGMNRNGSFIKKEAYENSVNSLYYTPVVGEWIQANENFGGHGGKVEITSNELKYIDTTIPYGCVGANADLNPRWELGSDNKEYFTVDIYLWTHKFPELQKTVKDSSWHSMEINVVNGYAAIIDKKDVFVIEQMEFTSLCILGKDKENLDNNVEPCFENSEIIAYTDKNNFKEDFTLMINELKYSLSNSALSYDKWVKNILRSEVDSRMADIQINNTELFSENTNTEEMCNTSKMENTEQMEVVETMEVIEEMEVAETMENTEQMENVESTEEMCNASKMESEVTLETTMASETETTTTTETETETETEDTNDEETENDETTTASKMENEDTNEANNFANVINEFEQLKYNYAELETNYNSILNENKLLNEKLQSKELTEKQNIIDTIFAKFNNIFSEDDLKDIKSKAINMEISEIESQLFAMYGQRMMKFNSQANKQVIDLGIIPQINNDKKEEISDVFMKAKNEINK